MDRESFLKTGAYFLGLVRFGADKNRRKELFPQSPTGWIGRIFFICRKNIPFRLLRFQALESADEKRGEVWEKWSRLPCLRAHRHSAAVCLGRIKGISDKG
ncbi:MAG: hypothetical protein ACLS4Z_05120 [Christensenellaceae bacterium]